MPHTSQRVSTRPAQPWPHAATDLRGRAVVSEETFVRLIGAFDAVLIFAVGIASYGIYLVWIKSGSDYDPALYFAAMAFAVLLAGQRLAALGAYSLDSLRNIKQQIHRTLAAWTGVVVLLVIAGFLLKVSSDYSRVWLLSWYTGTAAMLVLSRIVIATRLRAWAQGGHYFRAVAVVGAGPLGQRFVERIQADRQSGLRVIGFFDDRRTRVPDLVHGVPVLGTTADLLDRVRGNAIDLVVIALPLHAEDRLLDLTRRLRALPVDIRLLSDAVGFHMPHKPVSYWAGIPALNVADKPITGWDFLAKRSSDIALSAVGLILLAPLLGALALAIKLDSPGPVLFRQKRFGFNHEVFDIYKFRTMRTDAADATAERLVTRDDARVTRLGRLLRRTSLDELPQLWNVLRGDMSLVGPRPHAQNAKAENKLYDEAVAEYAARHRVKPGITGWAQVNGWRGETDTLEKIQRRVDHDLYYIDRWSLALDAWILLMTAVKVVRGKNAY